MLVAYVVPQLAALMRGTDAVSTAALLSPVGLPEALWNALLWNYLVPDPRFVEETASWPAAALSVSAAVVLVLAGSGLVSSWRRGWSREWAAVAVGLLAVVVLSAMRVHVVDLLAVPWYSRWDRLVLLGVPVVVPFVGLGAAAWVAWWRTRMSAVAASPAATRRRGVLVAAVAALLWAPLLWACWTMVNFGFSRASLAGPAERDAFAWLAAHDAPDGRVLNDPTDGSAWMWALASVPPLFPSPPHQAAPDVTRSYLLGHAAAVGKDPKATAIADEYGVRYAYVGARLYPFRTTPLQVSKLVGSGAWRIVYTSGGATVLERAGGSP
jgi:hypothetical protein